MQEWESGGTHARSAPDAAGTSPGVFSVTLPVYRYAMSRTYARISELQRHDGATVTVRAWVTHVRTSGKVAFAVLRDGTGTA